MRSPLGLVLLCSALAVCGCAGNEAKVVGNGNVNSASNAGRKAAGTDAAPSSAAPPSAAPSSPAPSVASSHGAAAQSAPQSQERPSVDTAELDAKIKTALKKAKARKATAADKLAAAAAYLERGNFYWSSQNPSLYKFALADFNSVLIYQPDNAEAKSKRDEIIRIYNSMGRPVPRVSNEK